MLSRKTNRRESRPWQRWLLTLMLGGVLLAGGGAPIALGDSNSVIGGNAIIPINPGFSPATQLFIPPNTPPPGGVDFLSNPVSDFLGLNQSLQVQIQVPVALGAALAQAISAGNRPSVLTPYAGILSGAGETAHFDSFGSLVTNKASTLGKGKLGLGLSYQHSKFDEFDGADIGRTVNQDIETVQNLSSVASTPFGDFNVTTVEPFRTLARIRAYDVEFKADVITFSLTYGLLENLDIGALIPYIFLQTSGKVKIDVEQSVQVRAVNPAIPLDTTFAPAGSRRTFKGKFNRDFEGVGDIILFTKWMLVSQYGLPGRVQGPVDMALQAELKLPTGNEDNFLGTGKTDVALRMLVQRSLTDTVRLRGEIGYNRSGLGNEFNSWEYKLGGEWLMSTNLAASAELIGSYSHAFHGILDAAVGAKYSVSRDFKVFAGVRAPLNDNGLRYAYSPIVGLEYVFSPRPKIGMESIQPEAPAGASDQPAAPMSFEQAPAAPGAQPVSALSTPDIATRQTAAGGALRLEPVDSLHMVGPKPASDAGQAQPAPKGDAADGGSLALPGVRQR